MIVLSLIPVYLSKNNSSVGTDRSDRYNAQIRLTNNGVVSIGDTLDTSARTLIANKVNYYHYLSNKVFFFFLYR